MNNFNFMNKKMIGAVVVSLVVGFGAGYFVHSAPAQTPNIPGGFAGRGGVRAGVGSANGAGILSGTVEKQDSGSITLNTRDGSSRVILITPATTVQKSVNGSMTDVAVGSTIFVTGTTNGDGSVSAASIQLRPAQPSATVGQ